MVLFASVALSEVNATYSSCLSVLTHSEASLLDTRQQEIERGLRRCNRTLADLYLGALRIMLDDQNPGRTYFLAHAAREILNRLPDAFGLFKDRFNTTKEIELLLPSWQPIRSVLAMTVQQLTQEEGKIPTATGDTISIPIRLAGELDEFFKRHERSQVETHRVKAAALFKTLAADHPTVKKEALEPVINQYRKLAGWFESEVHVGNEDPSNFSECERRFQLLEAFLLTLLAPDFYSSYGELNDIIDQANG
jgi:hypothetical protein